MDRENHLEDLKEELYSTHTKGSVIDHTKGTNLSPREVSENNSANAWPETVLPDHGSSEYHPATKFFKYLFIASVVFCLCAGAVAGFVFLSGWNQISSDNLDISIAAPVSVAGGEVFPFSVSIANKNRIDLYDVRAYVTYPSGARDTTGASLLHEDRVLETISTGSQKETKFQAILFGEENVLQEIGVVVEYKITGGTTVYKKEQTYSVLLTKAPISVLVDYQKEINANQEIVFTVSAISNSRAPLSNILLKAVYPVGFVVKSTNVTPLENSSDTWDLGSFEPGEKKDVVLRGVVQGQDTEEKNFRFSIGARTDLDSSNIATVYSNFLATVYIERPFISTQLSLGLSDSAKSTLITTPGSQISGSLTFKNNTPKDIFDVTIQLIPPSTYVDRYSISGNGGFYQSSENTLVWNKNTLSDLETLGSGISRKVSFSFKTLSAEQLSQVLRNPQINVKAIVSGKTVTSSGGTQTISVETEGIIKFSTSASLSAKTLYSTGPFTNSGPVPARSEQKTTYTIQLSLTNTSNQISDGVVTATLPIYAQWTGAISPGSEKISYDSNKRTITWQVGEVPAYSGIRSAARSVYFGVELYPSISQIGSRPILVSDILFSGIDRFTNTMIKLGPGRTDTTLSDSQISGQIKE